MGMPQTYTIDYANDTRQRIRDAAVNGFLEGFCGFGFLDFGSISHENTTSNVPTRVKINVQKNPSNS